MSSNVDQYFALQELDRKLLKRACMAGETDRTRKLVLLHFPKINPRDVSAFIRQIANMAA